LNRNKILLIDDEVGLLKVYRDYFQFKGYEVITAEDGEQGLRMARQEKPDLIILDVMLPKLDGFNVCRLLKFDENHREIPIIMLTARGTERDRAIGNETGADVYLVKPIELEVLAKTVEDLLAKE
jgi:two-component system alkaline phosphatase synthesis response regulator PhoP